MGCCQHTLDSGIDFCMRDNPPSRLQYISDCVAKQRGRVPKRMPTSAGEAAVGSKRETNAANSSHAHAACLVTVGRETAHWVWQKFVERNWRPSRYGGKKKRCYRLPQNSKAVVRRRLRNLAELTWKLNAALSRPQPK